MNLSHLASRTEPKRRHRVYLIHKRTGKISSVVVFTEPELVLCVANKSPDYSYVTNDADMLLKITPVHKSRKNGD